MRYARYVAGVLLLACGAAGNLCGEERWAKEIAAFAEQDLRSPPPRNAILFVGSSSILRWNLEKSFPRRTCINRGFGGSWIEDSVRYVHQIVTPYQPRAIVLYAGDNDLKSGGVFTPERVAADFGRFVAAVREKLPDTPIFYISIKPSIDRWNLIDKIRATNALIKAQCREDQSLFFIDVEPVMVGANGRPKPEMFIDDGLHLSEAGYQAWATLVEQALAQHVDNSNSR